MREVIFTSAHIDGDEESFVVFCYDGGTDGMLGPVSITCADTGREYRFCARQTDAPYNGSYVNTDWVVDDVKYDHQRVILRLKPIEDQSAQPTDVVIGSMIYAGDLFELDTEERITVRLHPQAESCDFTS